MFKRLIYEDWQTWIPIAAFFITFTVFALFLIRALRLEKREVERLAHLPFSPDDCVADRRGKEKEEPTV